jgi:hypothetical protein
VRDAGSGIHPLPLACTTPIILGGQDMVPDLMRKIATLSAMAATSTGARLIERDTEPLKLNSWERMDLTPYR